MEQAPGHPPYLSVPPWQMTDGLADSMAGAEYVGEVQRDNRPNSYC